MRELLVCVLLCSALILAESAKSGPNLLAEWLEQQTAPATVPPTTAKSASAAAPGPPHEEAQFEWGCFKATGEGNCRCIGCAEYCTSGGDCNNAGQCCATEYFTSSFSCCAKSDHGSYEGDLAPLLANKMQIGSCEITQHLFSVSDPTGPVVEVIKDRLYKLATFTALCNVNAGGECGHPFCDSMVLTWQGTKYMVNSAVSKTNDVPLERPGCRRAGFLPERKAAEGLKPAAQSPAKLGLAARKADAADVAISSNTGAADYFVGAAAVYSGPITISSRKYDIKYHSGFMDYVSDWYPDGGFDNPVKVPAAEAADYYKVVPNTYTLKLQKEDGY